MSEPTTTPAPRGGWDVLARDAARRRESEEGPELLQQILTFELAGAPYALPVERVREIVRMRPMTPVPRVPADVRGVISLRGEIVQVIDLRSRVGLETADTTRSSRIVIVHGEDGQVAGLLVDAVTEVYSVREEALRPASGEAVESLCLRDDRFVSMVDLERVLSIDAGS